MPRFVTLIFFLAMLATESRANGVMYYVTDWQGNNVAVEPIGQRYLFAGKEREHAGGRNTYDFGARSLTPYGRWGVPDPFAEKFYPFSPYSHCCGDPINHTDYEGNVVILVNGMHNGSGGSAEYWDGIDEQIKNDFQDFNVIYYDGAIGGMANLTECINPAIRQGYGTEDGYRDAPEIISNLKEGEKIKFVSHSMGAAYTKGFIFGLKRFAIENDIDIKEVVAFELDLAPFQPKGQSAHRDIKTVTIQHYNDGIALPVKMPEAKNIVTHTEVPTTILNLFLEHKVISFSDDIKQIINDKTITLP